VGLDISTAQFPPAISLAPNITLETYDMFQAPPEKYDSYFDVIHIRLVVGAVRADPLPVIRNLLQMLKPGGTLQWGEVKPLEVAIFPDSPATAHVRTKLEALWQQLLGPKNVDGTHRMDWVGALAGIFRASGLFEKGSVLEVNFGVPREGMWNYWSVNELGAMEEICKGIGRKDLVEAFEEIEALMAKEGVCLNYDPVVVVGRKK
jgi:SAM-dependent methyltransferase